jgi:hypothetical protein
LKIKTMIDHARHTIPPARRLAQQSPWRTKAEKTRPERPSAFPAHLSKTRMARKFVQDSRLLQQCASEGNIDGTRGPGSPGYREPKCQAGLNRYAAAAPIDPDGPSGLAVMIFRA